MPRCSNSIVCCANFLTAIVAALLICGGLWIKADAQSQCQHGLQWMLIISGAALLLLSFCGIIGSCCRLNFFLWIYLFFMFLLIVFTLVAVAFSFAVSGPKKEAAVPDSELVNTSSWLQKFAIGDWDARETCMREVDLCGGRVMVLLNRKDSFRGQLLRKTDLYNQISPIQLGCCVPPSECGYTHVNDTYWEPPAAGKGSTAGDCIAWSNEGKCYGCDSCKAGMVELVRRNIRFVAKANLAGLVILIIIYTMGCCAFRNNRYG